MSEPHFNLWTEAWIMVERPDGSVTSMGIADLLHNAHYLRRIFDPSPLVVVGIHRLLTAILQDMVRPQANSDLVAVWRAGRFDVGAIEAFGETYADRFDLFSEDAPFMQSADLPRTPAKNPKPKPVGYLFQEQPAGTAVTHYRHDYDDATVFCAACASKGLITLSAFASSGGATFKPSINGVPPIYILPGGATLFEQLAASLLTPKFQPDVADSENDRPWWRHAPIVKAKDELLRVGYLHSLTFPARQVRLHPAAMHAPCTRCGRQTVWGTGRMIYRMGESRPKDAPFWQDPFASYRIDKKGNKPPIPVRPVLERVLWREFANLFLLADQTTDNSYERPGVINQLEEDALWGILPFSDYLPFKVVGLRTDMKMKIFEWQESDFQVPSDLVRSLDGGIAIETSITIAVEVDRKMKSVFYRHFGGDSHAGKEMNKTAKKRMSEQYWTGLTDLFRAYVYRFDGTNEFDTLLNEWAEEVRRYAEGVFKNTMKQMNTTASTLQKRVEAESHLRAALNKYYKKLKV